MAYFPPLARYRSLDRAPGPGFPSRLSEAPSAVPRSAGSQPGAIQVGMPARGSR